VTKTVVTRKRKQLGIRASNKLPWASEQIALLGTMPDAEVAARIGEARGAVVWMRRKHGIRPWAGG
jgi:hypothetical protein